MNRSLLFFLVLALSGCIPGAAFGDPASACVEQGALAGATDHIVDAFLGVPFAAPPVASTASRYWLNFIRNGDPSGGGLVPWPAFDATSNQYIEMGERVGTRALDARKLELFEQAARTGRPLSLF